MINILNIDDHECLKWCLIRYLNPKDHNLRKITKANQEFAERINFKDMKLQSKLETFLKSKTKKRKKKKKSKYKNFEKQNKIIILDLRGL